ncbi:MAG: hypothetical protein M5T61_20830 [Acidimicrobiia bacterium]|nr:hypothetical protein [Acidimicrobiia bacterium]
MRDLNPARWLAVHTDDLAARVGVPAWCRLTGSRLVRADTDRPTSPDDLHISREGG